jgi:hypothetical protein
MFEDACTDTLRFLFVPPLQDPLIQPRSFSGIDRRDLVFPNRNLQLGNNWGHLYQELAARLVLFEFKMRIPTHGGHRFQSDRGRPSDLMAASVPI